MRPTSILDNIDLSQVAPLVENQNILVSQFSSFSQLRGLFEFEKMGPKYKLLLFYYEYLSSKVIQRLKEYSNVITCKYSEASDLYKFIPMIKSDLNFSHAFICDIGISRFYWTNVIGSFDQILGINSDQNTYLIPLAGELIDDNFSLRNEFKLNTWHRLSPDHLIVKNGNEFPLELLDSRFKTDDSIPKLMLSMMQYIQDNLIGFNYQILIFGNRIPFYYWLEHVKPSENKKFEFLQKMINVDQIKPILRPTIEEYIGNYEFQKRRELYWLIKENIRDLSFFEDPLLIDCIKRTLVYFKNPDNVIYSKRW